MPSIINATTSTGLVSSADNSGSLQLATNNGTTAVTIDTSQNVGIGTSSPTTVANKNLQVYAGSGASAVVRVTGNAGTGFDFLQGGDGAAYVWNRDNTATLFGTNNTERMRIDSSGNLLVGLSSNVFDANTAIGMTYNPGINYGISIRASTTSSGTAVNFRNPANSQVGAIGTSNTATTYNTSSDYRLKENIVPMTGALDKVTQLKPVTYKWKSDGSDGQGFIAHELQAVVPDCVTGEKDGEQMQGVDTSFLVATLTAAIQELKAELDATKAEVQALKGVA